MPLKSQVFTEDALDDKGYLDPKKVEPKQKEAWVLRVFQGISKDYDRMNDLGSFGQHRIWKSILVETVAKLEPQDVLDVACGTGDIALGIASKDPHAKVVGLDMSCNMLNVARSRNATAQSNVDFVQGSALELPFEDASFDVVTISFGLRNMADYRLALEEMVRVLRPNGCFFCLEASYPTIPVFKQVFKLYFKHFMPWMANLITKKEAEYRWLNDSTEAFLTKDQLVSLMDACGLAASQYESFNLGVAALHFGIKP